MPFSVSTCLTGLGTVTLGPTLTIYSNPIPPNNQGVFVGNVSTSLITGGACPYTFIVPDGTTTVRLFDPVTFCYADIPVSNNNVCSTCNLTFTSISNNLLSTINVGSLAGTCDPAITDYRINWYGPNNPTQLAFTSGEGTIWSARDATQPITPTSLDAPFLQSGTYVSKITEVKLNNARFSYIGGPNNVLSPSLLNCSYTVSVSPYTCLNGIDPPIDGYYAHQKEYTSDGSSLPQGYTADFSLAAGTKAFIWAFQPYSVYDTLKLTFNGSSYANPIVLEEIQIGSGLSSNTLPTTFPKVWSQQSYEEYRKITMLTGLIVNNNDSISIKVTPNPSFNNTNWKLKFGCYTPTTTTKTCLDDYKNKPYMIQKSSILTGLTDTCGSVFISFKVSGCSGLDNLTYFTSDLYNLTSKSSIQYASTNEPSKLSDSITATFRPERTILGESSSNLTDLCTSGIINSGTITVSKSNVNEFTIFCTNQSDILEFESSFNNRITASKNLAPGVYVNDPTDINYYRFIQFKHYSNAGNTLCGDSTLYFGWWIHVSSTYTLVPTPGGYLMTVQTPLITNNYVCTSACDANCPGIINGYITGAQGCNTLRSQIFNYSNTSRLRFTKPFWYSRTLKLIISPKKDTSEPIGYLQLTPKYSTNTYAWSSDGLNTLLPSFFATSWDWENHFAEKGTTTNTPYYNQDLFKYKVYVVSYPPNFRFQIFAQPISNFSASGTYITAPVYDSDFPSAFNPTYVY